MISFGDAWRRLLHLSEHGEVCCLEALLVDSRPSVSVEQLVDEAIEAFQEMIIGDLIFQPSMPYALWYRVAPDYLKVMKIPAAPRAVPYGAG
jgi:hypothetical protein